MKSIIKKSAFVLFLVLVLSFGIVASNAVSEYKLTISAKSMNVGLNSYTQVEAEIEGLEVQPEFVWSTSDESIAKINEQGKVKGIALGNFDVIATAVIGEEIVTAKFPMKVVKDENEFKSYLEMHNLLSFQYSYDYDGYYYANDKKSWQEDFGFATNYDYMSPYIGFEYDYIRVFFPYDNQDFMLQLWKGQYLIGYGGEIGLYHRDADGLKTDADVIYNAADSKYWPIMDMGVFHQKNEGDAPEDYELLFRRPVDKYWWCTGFVPGMLRDNNPADELRIESVITFKDEEMAGLVADELGRLGFVQAESADTLELDGYYLDGTNVHISWQNLIEPDVEKDWTNIGVFFIGILISILIKWGLPELAKLFAK